MEFTSGRVTDPSSLSEAEITTVLTRRGQLVIQFSQPSAYTPALLQQLNTVCRRSPDSLEVRFFGHYGKSFDAANMRYLPDVKNLSLDCLQQITNEDEIAQLPSLSRLSFGVFNFDRPNFFEMLNLGQIRELSIGENRKKNFDLAAIAAGSSLESLDVAGHWRGIDAITSLSCLKNVSLRYLVNTRSVEFLGKVPKLSCLTLILGGRENIAEFASHSLHTFQIIRVRGLRTLGELGRFPSLSHLRIEDQLQLKHLDLTGVDLERLCLHNCKNLKTLAGLNIQSRMREFSASRVALDLNGLRDFAWPATMKSVGLFSGSQKWNDATRDHLNGRGYRQIFTRWS